MPEKIFFQSSLPRAGSTFFQNLMAQNPDFYCTPTSGVLELVYAARGNYTNSPEFKAQDKELMAKGFRGFCKNGITSFFNAITDKKYVLDKSRGWGIHRDFVKDFMGEEPKIICMVRDLRDILASMEKKHRENPLIQQGILNHSEMKGTSVPKRIDLWLGGQPVGLALERLSEIIRMGYAKNILFVKYEDLCLYPETEMIKVYDYLKLPYFNHNFDEVEQVTSEDDSVYNAGSLHVIRKKLEWRKSDADTILGRDVTKWIFDNHKWFFDYFNYKK